MEAAGRISEEWSSLSGFYTAEEADFMTQLLGNDNCSIPEELLLYENPSLGFPCSFESTIVSLNCMKNNTTSYFPSSVAANHANFFCFTPSGGNINPHNNDTMTNFDTISMGFSFGDAKSMPFSAQSNGNTDEESGLERVPPVADKNFQDNVESEALVSEPAQKGDKSSNVGSSEKRSRSSSEVSKNKRNVKPKRNAKSGCVVSKNEEDRSQRQSSSSSYSEDDDSINGSQELNGGATSSLSTKDDSALKSNGKSMSNNKGPATDPQSVYARRRRERINERLRILQNLVPNGTKVDISTMLEEAVQYVKFLQLQIKLLSSDDMWMYAPIAYNGLNIGLDLNLSPTKQP